ncbi:MAG: hypothetical protein ACK4JB_06375 [Reyranella sp.]
MKAAFPIIVLLLAALAGSTGCEGIPKDSRYQGYGRGSGEMQTGLPATPYDPNAR